MKIILLTEWMGNKKGAVLDLVDFYAKELIRRGSAKPYTAPRKKQVKSAPKDKMMREPKKMK